MQQQKIEFRKERDFSSVLGDAFSFLRQNFKSLFGSIIFIIGPFILITGVAYGYIQSIMLQNPYYANPVRGLSSLALGEMFNSTYFLSIGVLLFFGLLTNILLNSVVYNFMNLYNEKPFGENISILEVGSRVWSNLGILIGSMFAFSLVFGAVILIIVLIFLGIISSAGIAGGVLLGLLLFFALLIFIPVLSYIIPAGFYVVVRDKSFIFSALGKVRRYLSGNFWWTWLIMVVAMIGLFILQILFNLPTTIMSFSQMFTRLQHLTDGAAQANDSSVLMIVFYTLGLFLTTCSTSIIHLICAFNFLGQEEKQEGKGLLSRMDEIK